MWNQVEKFGGKGNFSLWQSVVQDVLIQQGLIDALEDTKLNKTVMKNGR
jgi:hypothetical protein